MEAAIATLGIASCKKEEIAQPEQTTATIKLKTVADTKESGAGCDDHITQPDGTAVSDTKESGAGWDNP